MAILKQGEVGVPIVEILRQHSISKATYFQWRSKYGETRSPGHASPAHPVGLLEVLPSATARRLSLEP